MLYYLFKFLDEQFDIAGAGLFQYLSFRAAMAIIISLLIAWVFGGRLIKILNRKQFKETVRDLGLQGEKQKQGTPTMGGVIILGAILIPSILLCKLENIYVQLMLLVTVWLGLIGFVDDYIKVFKKDKGGLKARAKLIGQFGVGILIGWAMFFSNDVVVRKDITNHPDRQFYQEIDRFEIQSDNHTHTIVDYKAPVTTIPFVKSSEFDYASLLSFLGGDYWKWAWIIYIPLITLIVSFISNGANLTDGLDGLATGTSAIMMVALLVLAYVSGNSITANYLNILHLPNVGELVIFAAAFIGACVGFMWYNAYPAQVFMGDTGSLSMGGIIATMAIILRKELLIPILCGVFIIENVSVMMQVGYFKWTKRKTGTGVRIFKMAPLHHHFQKLGMHESKIVARFWIVGLLLAVLTFMTLKIR